MRDAIIEFWTQMTGMSEVPCPDTDATAHYSSNVVSVFQLSWNGLASHEPGFKPLDAVVSVILLHQP